jgi:hypothetical protein
VVTISTTRYNTPTSCVYLFYCVYALSLVVQHREVLHCSRSISGFISGTQTQYLLSATNGISTQRFDPFPSSGRVNSCIRDYSYLAPSSAQTQAAVNLSPLRRSSSGMLRRVSLVRTDVSEEIISASIIRVRRIGELGTTLALTSNRHTQLRYTQVASNS